MNVKRSPLMAAATVAGLLLSGCGGGGNGSAGIPSTTSVNPTSVGKLTFAVGTANIDGTTGLNVVAMYRSSNGLAASLVNTPTISGPMSLPATAAAPSKLSADPFSTIPGGPGPVDLAAKAITGTPQSVHQGTTPTTATESSFGQSGGVFSQSLSPGNETTGGTPYSYVPYGIDVYGTTALAGDPANEPFGGPPAFDPDGNGMGLRDGLNNLGAGVVGIPEGFTSFEAGIVPVAGQYTMSLAVATGFSGSTPTTATVTGTATLSSVTPLPTLTAPAFTPDGNGGGSVTLPSADFTGGVSEVYVQIIDTGNGKGNSNCQGVRGATGGAGPVYYTIVATAAGTYTLPDTDGPNLLTSGGPSALQASPSICTVAQNTAANGGTASPGDNYEVQLIGTDYDMYGASLINPKKPPAQVPSFNGTQADITVSAPVTGTSI
jgi:hypothetical protein